MAAPLSQINIKVISAIFLLVLSTVQFAWLYQVHDFPLGMSLLDSLGSYALLYAIFIFFDRSLNYYLPGSYGLLIIIAESALIALAWVYTFEWSLLFIYHKKTAYTRFWDDSFYIRAFIGWILLTNYCLLSYLSNRVGKEAFSEQQMMHNEQLKKEAELYKLRQQLHPHFLFNSLNSINALIGREPVRARAMLQQLSEFLRHTLKKEDNDYISFGDELKDMRLYLGIEQVRFGHRLKIVENIRADCPEKKIPPFLMQPLLENAVKYGLYGTIGTVEILMNAECHAGFLQFEIINPYDPTAVPPTGTGFGLGAVSRRLYLLFARNDLLVVDKEEGATPEDPSLFKVTLKIPFTSS